MGWTPIYERWRHGGWYVINARNANGSVAVVSRNYPDKKWRIAGHESWGTFRNRDAAAETARAKQALGITV